MLIWLQFKQTQRLTDQREGSTFDTSGIVRTLIFFSNSFWIALFHISIKDAERSHCIGICKYTLSFSWCQVYICRNSTMSLFYFSTNSSFMSNLNAIDIARPTWKISFIFVTVFIYYSVYLVHKLGINIKPEYRPSGISSFFFSHQLLFWISNCN